jgi:hypothetical protein
MNEAIKKVEDVNVADEFLSDDEEKIDNIRIVGDEKEEERDEDLNITNPAKLFEEEYSEVDERSEEFPEESDKKEDETIESAEKEEMKTYEEENEEKEILKGEVKENLVDDDFTEAPSSKANVDSEDDYADKLLGKIKIYQSELGLLIEGLERQVLEDKKVMSDQKFYIKKIEKEASSLSNENIELKKSLEKTNEKLKRAEKKLEIVKRELLD